MSQCVSSARQCCSHILFVAVAVAAGGARTVAFGIFGHLFAASAGRGQHRSAEDIEKRPAPSYENGCSKLKPNVEREREKASIMTMINETSFETW